MDIVPVSRMWCFSVVFCVLFVTVFDFVFMQFESPCPNIFEYDFDERQRLYGTIKIDNPPGNVINLNVELSVGNSVQGYNGQIELAQSRDRAVDEILKGNPVYYRVIFPFWRTFPPKITKILINGNLFCSGPPLDIKRVPVLTTINLQHTLKLSSINLSPTASFAPSSNANSNYWPFQNPPNTYQEQSPPKNNDDDFAKWYVQFGSLPQNPGQQYPENPFFAPPATTTGRPYFNNVPTTEKSQGYVPNFFDVGEDVLNNSPLVNNAWITKPTRKPTTTTKIPRTTRTTTAIPDYSDLPAIIDEHPDIDVRDNLNNICGKSLATNSLVAHGTPIVRGYYPWLVALYSKKYLNLEFTCGGTLVSTKHVVTAAHCLRPYEKKVDIDQLLIILGKYNIQRWTNDKDAVMLDAEKISIHPEYRALTADADIAVITLSQEIRFRKLIRPICLWSGNSDLNNIVGENGVVAGWGKDENGAALSPEPKQVTLPVVSQVECLRSHTDFADVTSERTFCAGYRNGSGPCNGDSGGGFMLKKNGRWVLRGVVSMSIADQSRNCDLSQYLVFTDVSKFSNWLLRILKE